MMECGDTLGDMSLPVPSGIVKAGDRVMFLQLTGMNMGSYGSDLSKHEQHI